jgi:hypothetical protein
MPIADLDENGFLPPGLHPASMAEIRERFGRFQSTDQRVQLQKSLEDFVNEARDSGLVSAIIVNGSFTTGKAAPSDIDLIVILRSVADFSADLRPDHYNVLSARRVKGRYPFDVRYALESPETLDPLVDFFAQVKGQGLRKGMVKVVL